MADLVSYTIPSLIQGVSNQPDAQRDPSQGEIQINGMSSIAEGLRKRDSSHVIAKVSDTPFGDAFIHSILRDESEKYLAVIAKTGIKVFDLAGQEYVVKAPGGYGYLANVTDAKHQIRAVSVADYTFILNTNTPVAMDPAVSPPLTRPTTHEALVWVKGANYGQKYSVNINGTLVEVTTAVAPVVTSGTTITENRISSAEIAEQIKTGFASLAGVTITRSGSVLWVQSANPITVSATDARANADITAILGQVQAFTELPTIAPKGYMVEIVGDPGNKFDGYAVQFTPKSGTFGEGTWAEVVAPGVEYKLKSGTMPHILVRLPNGTFHFGAADGSTHGGVDLPAWGERTAGDYDTAPDPSFVGHSINDITVFKNRLVVLADENIILSRTREFFEFFPSTVTTVLDTDPIDLTASNNRVSVLRYAVPSQDELILFSAQYQFRFNASETVLTPATAQITVLTQYEMDPLLRPQQAGGGIIFCQANGEWSQLREFSIRGAGTALVADSQDLTGYVSSYIPRGLYKLTVNDSSNCAFFISEQPGYEDRIYVYKYFFRNSGNGSERAQSSWSYWQFKGKVLQIICIEEVLYCLFQHGTKVFLEKIPVQDRLSSSSYPLLLDREVSTTADTPAAMRVPAGVFDPITRKTTWTLPYEMLALTEAWSGYSKLSRPTSDFTSGVLLASASSGTKLVARGDWSAADVFFGESYEFRYRFSRFKYMKEIGGGKASVNYMRTQVRSARLRYHETGYFEVHVMPEGRRPGKYTFDGTVSAVRDAQISQGNPILPDLDRYFEYALISQGSPALDFENALISPANPALDFENALISLNPVPVDLQQYFDGVFTIPIMSRGEQCLVEIKNATPHPCKFSTCEWAAVLTGKTRGL